MKKGFTLIELLIVVAIIGILSVALVPTGMNALKKARDGTRMAHMATLETAISQWVLDNNSGCPDSTKLAIYIQGGVPKDPSTNAAYPVGGIPTATPKWCYAAATLEFGGGNAATCTVADNATALPVFTTTKGTTDKCQFVYVDR